MVIIDKRKVDNMADLLVQTRPAETDPAYGTWVAVLSVIRAYAVGPEYQTDFDAHFSDADCLAFRDLE